MMLSFAIPVALYIFSVNDAYVFIEQGVSSKSKNVVVRSKYLQMQYISSKA